MSNEICQRQQRPTISWTQIKTQLLGPNVKEKDVKFKYICDVRKDEAVTLPFTWHYFSAVEACQVLGRGFIHSFDTPEDLSNFDFEHIFGETFEDLDFIWTPYTDFLEEGVYRDESTGLVVRDFNWAEKEPSGGTALNNVALTVSSLSFASVDVRGYDGDDITLACVIPEEALLTFRGGCEKSYLTERSFYAVNVDGILTYVSFRSTIVYYDYAHKRWAAKNTIYPHFSAYSESIGKSLTLGKHNWHVSNDSDVRENVNKIFSFAYETIGL